MLKQCPNCGAEIENTLKKCPKCEFDFSINQDSSAGSLNQASEAIDELEKEKRTSNFINREKNENIEWSELKDMSIGHVMDIFNETEELSDEKSELEEKSSNTSNEIEMDASEDPNILEGEQLESFDEIIDTTNNSDEEEKFVENSSTLQEYLQDHRTKEIVKKEAHVETVENGELKSDGSEKRLFVEETKDIKQTTLKEQTSSDQQVSDKKKDESETTEKQLDQKKNSEKKTPSIPSKSKRPEEIEMDEAPIFFKDKDEKPGPKNIPSNFVKSSSEITEVSDRETKPEPSISPLEDKNLSSKKNYKKPMLIIGAVLVLGGASWFFYHQLEKGTIDSTEVSKERNNLDKETKENLQGYFTNQDQEFLKPAMVSVSLATIKENLEKLKDNSDYKTMVETYNKVESKQKIVTEVNQLFETPIVAGDKLNDVAIASDEEITVKKLSGTNKFDLLINQGIDQANSQYNQLQNAKKAIAVFYQHNEITNSLTQETFDVAKNEVNQVKSEKLKAPLVKILTEASQKLTNQKQASSDSISEISQKSNTVVDDGNQTQAVQSNGYSDTNGFTGPNSQGVYTEPVYTVNPADVADATNPAWVWASGIQEKVLATCVERGYITAGNYSLQPARIVNGEGYYNLYGGQNQYLVTINAQTGWFKGNASRNAGR